MKMEEVKFKTEKTVCFREYDVRPGAGFVIDIDLEAGFLGVSELYDYDDSLYADVDAVITAIRSNCTDIITRCLSDWWEKDVSVCGNWQSKLPGLFDKELEKFGIKAETYFTRMLLTEESAKELNERKKEEIRCLRDQNPISIDTVYHEPTVLKNYVLNKAPEGKAVIRSGDKFCRNCGAALSGNGRFCMECGVEIISAG